MEVVVELELCYVHSSNQTNTQFLRDCASMRKKGFWISLKFCNAFCLTFCLTLFFTGMITDYFLMYT